MLPSLKYALELYKKQCFSQIYFCFLQKCIKIELILINQDNMFEIDLNQIVNDLYIKIAGNIELYLPLIIWALIILWFWVIIAYWIHKLVMFLFKKFKIIELIDKLNIDFEAETKWKNKDKLKEADNDKEIPLKNKISDKIKINEITAKASAYYVFLVFFRLAISFIGIDEIEAFMNELLIYLPKLFVWVIIWFFWIRFANFIYDLVYHTLDLTKQKTAKIVASSAKIIILFFTIMAVLEKIWIGNNITDTILIWFISMLAIAWWLAFWLWWKDIAHEILENLKK